MLLNPSYYPDQLKDLMRDLELKAQHFQYCALTLSQEQQNRIERLHHRGLVTQAAILNSQDNAQQKLDKVLETLTMHRLDVLEGLQLLLEASGKCYERSTYPTRGLSNDRLKARSM
jgi:hypothetical protein